MQLRSGLLLAMAPSLRPLLTLALLLLPAQAAFILTPHPAAAAAAAPPDADAAAAARALGAAAAAAATPFAYPSLEEVEARVAGMVAAHPTLARAWTAQQAYGTQAGTCRERGQPVVCKHTFLKLTNFTSGEGSASAAQSQALLDRPQLFFSGNLHGDEWVGPVTLLALAELLLACGADARAACFSPWLARLLNTRTLVLLIVSNPAGYSREGGPVREDSGLDPNRDFPYATADCLRSSTAQAINSAWREHVFQLAVTFHGGMESITYEWGAPAQTGSASESPDDAAQAALCGAMRDVAGVFDSHPYALGRTNDIVYPVEGGMEDWAYAGALGGGGHPWVTSARGRSGARAHPSLAPSPPVNSHGSPHRNTCTRAPPPLFHPPPLTRLLGP
jgi:hypothetical protein